MEHYDTSDIDPDTPGAMQLYGGPHDGAVLVWGPATSCDPWIAVDHDGHGQDRLVVFTMPAVVEGRARGLGLGLLPLLPGEEHTYPRKRLVHGLGWVDESPSAL